MSDLHTISTDRTAQSYRNTADEITAARKCLVRHQAFELADMLVIGVEG